MVAEEASAGEGSRRRVRAMVDFDFDDAERRWLVSPQGLLSACREAVACADSSFFDLVISSPLLERLDDESPSTTGPRPSDRAASLISSGRLAQWCLGQCADATQLKAWLEVAITGFLPPADRQRQADSSPVTAPAGMLDALEIRTRDPRVRAAALIEAVHDSADQAALLAVSDLVHDYLPGADGPRTSGPTTVLILTDRHITGELVHLVVVERDGPPGIAIDPLSSPFTRTDRAFAAAMETAWQVAQSPSLSARWAVKSDRTGAALEEIHGSSVGAGAAVALRHLSGSGLPLLDPSWAFTGAVDATGNFLTLLEEDHNLAAYQTKLKTAGHRIVVVPTCDHYRLAKLVDGGALEARLRPAGSVSEVFAAAELELGAQQEYLTRITPVAATTNSGVTSLDRSVLGVLDARGKRVGAAFLVTGDQALTCAHVVSRAVGAAAAGKGAQLKVDLPLARTAEGRTASAVVERWLPARDRSDDIAVLRLLDPLPEGRPVRMIEVADGARDLVRIIGFPEGREAGVWHGGQLLGERRDGWIEAGLSEVTGYRLDQGFDGAPVWDEELDGVVGMVVAIEGSRAPTAHVIPVATRSGPWPDLQALVRPPSPYRGLTPFRETDHGVFFGRNSEIGELAERVRGRGPVALVGPSGCGKSSLVFAGLLPALRNSGLAVVTVRPSSGRTVYRALAAALLPLLEPDLTVVARLGEVPRLAEMLEEAGLHEVVPAILGRTGASDLLVVLDQAEELLAQQPEQVDRLAGQLFGPGSPSHLRVLLTLRADFLGVALSSSALSAALRQSVYTVGAMAGDQLREIVVSPATEAGIAFQGGLVERIMADVGTDPGALPFLSLTLSLLWDRQFGGELTHAGYEAVGGVRGSVTGYAEEIWRTLGLADEEPAARQLFAQLVRMAPGGEVTRRVAIREDLRAPQWTLAQRLATTRLLVTGRAAEGGETVELAHEALIKGWDRLQRWVESDQEFRLWQEAVRADLARWERAERDPGLLLRGRALAEALRWQAQRAEDLSVGESDFVLQAEHHHRRTNRRRRVLSSGLVLVLVLVLLLGNLFISEQAVARRERAAADSRSLAARSTALAERDPAYSTLLALAAHKRSPTEEARNALFRQYLDYQNADTVLSGAPDLEDVQMTGDGRVAAGRTATGSVTVWRRSADGAVDASTTPRGVQAQHMMLLPDGSAVWLVTRLTRQLTRFDIPTGQVSQVIPFDLPNGTNIVGPAAISPDGGRLALVFGTRHRTIISVIWDTRSGRRVDELVSDGAELPKSTAFTFTGGTLALVFPRDGVNEQAPQRIELWDIAVGSRRSIGGPFDRVLLPSGGQIAVACQRSDAVTRFTAYQLADGAEVGHADVKYANCPDFVTDAAGQTVVVPDYAFSGPSPVLDLRSGAQTGGLDLPQPRSPSDEFKAFPELVGSGEQQRLVLYDTTRILLVDARPHDIVPAVKDGVMLPDGDNFLVVFRGGAAMGVFPTGDAVGLVGEAARPAPYWGKSEERTFAVGWRRKLVADRVASDTVMLRRLPGLEPFGPPITTQRVPERNDDSASDEDRAKGYTNMFFDRAGRLVTVVGHRVEWWDPSSGGRVATLDLLQQGYVMANEAVTVTPSLDPAQIAVVVPGRPDVHVLDVASGKEVRTIRVGPDVVAVGEFEGPDSPYMTLVRRGGNTIEVWDIEKERLAFSPQLTFGVTPGGGGGPSKANFLDRPGQYFIAASGKIEIWDVASATLESSLSLGKDRFVTSASASGRVLLYEDAKKSGGTIVLDPEVWRTHLCKVTGRKGFTESELVGLPLEIPTRPLCPG